MKITVWGCRGSIPAPGPDTVRYGGNTSCYELRSDNGELLILDAGSGLRELGLSLGGKLPQSAHLLVSHTHWDHIMGYPFFSPLYMRGNKLHVMGAPHYDAPFRELMGRQMHYAYFPVRMDDLAADQEFENLREGEHQVGKFKVITRYMNHPVTCLGFRIEVDGRSVVYPGDHEPYYDIVYRQREPANDAERQHKAELEAFAAQQNQAVFEFVRDADLLICDGMFTSAEYEAHVGWGHSAMEYWVETALAANVKRLMISHHDPCRTDAQIDKLLAHFRADLRSRGEKMNLSFAMEGRSLDLAVSEVQAAL